MYIIFSYFFKENWKYAEEIFKFYAEICETPLFQSLLRTEKDKILNKLRDLYRNIAHPQPKTGEYILKILGLFMDKSSIPRPKNEYELERDKELMAEEVKLMEREIAKRRKEDEDRLKVMKQREIDNEMRELQRIMNEKKQRELDSSNKSDRKNTIADRTGSPSNVPTIDENDPFAGTPGVQRQATTDSQKKARLKKVELLDAMGNHSVHTEIARHLGEKKRKEGAGGEEDTYTGNESSGNKNTLGVPGREPRKEMDPLERLLADYGDKKAAGVAYNDFMSNKSQEIDQTMVKELPNKLQVIHEEKMKEEEEKVAERERRKREIAYGMRYPEKADFDISALKKINPGGGVENRPAGEGDKKNLEVIDEKKKEENRALYGSSYDKIKVPEEGKLDPEKQGNKALFDSDMKKDPKTITEGEKTSEVTDNEGTLTGGGEEGEDETGEDEFTDTKDGEEESGDYDSEGEEEFTFTGEDEKTDNTPVNDKKKN